MDGWLVGWDPHVYITTGTTRLYGNGLCPIGRIEPEWVGYGCVCGTGRGKAGLWVAVDVHTNLCHN